MADGAPFGEARDRSVAGLAERDRRLAHALAAGVLRHRRTIDRALGLDRADPRVIDVLRLGAYQLLRLTRVPPHAAVSTAVELARETAGEGAARYVNHALRELQRRPAAGAAGAAGGTHPEWLVRRWRARFGAAGADLLLRWNDAPASLILQPARGDAGALRRGLAAAGLAVRDAPFGAGLRVAPGPAPRPALRALPGYAEGAFIVQDPAQALVCRFAAIPPGARVYDACAAPGGKAVTLERLGARVTAGDAARHRIPRLADTVRRAGVAIRVVCADLLCAPWRPESWDAVLLDAPCTATGTMSRHPDARWRITPAAIARAAARQRRLLAAAAHLVRAGGVLVYATCSLEPEENEAVVNDFLDGNPRFARAPVADAVPAGLVTAAGDLTLLPQRDGTDGAYAARLVRRP